VEWLAIALQFIADELENTRPGRDTIISRLMDILFIMVVRYWIDHHAASEKGWLSALRDPQIASALGDIHRQPEHTWTVEKLAAGAHLSRSAFAARFTALVGEPPLAYLTRWRMQLAMAWLLDDTETLEAIARKVGYSSAYAFSKTFKRLVGVAPGEYRRGQHKAAE
jgi:AraC-like DNA-binding protein